jgi:hypothetical protein
MHGANAYRKNGQAGVGAGLPIHARCPRQANSTVVLDVHGTYNRSLGERGSPKRTAMEWMHTIECSGWNQVQGRRREEEKEKNRRREDENNASINTQRRNSKLESGESRIRESQVDM